ncbi:MAG TPA: gliding motility-associated C-terminal domain-containing protein [Bacteroidia bacterium]|nr:gliding motility-associated C-terminal domain-containing protein [Bacteroidia bacterium]
MYFVINATGYAVYALHIYDRWGAEIFVSDSPGDSWNGRLRNTGNECADDTYYYILHLTDHAHETTYNGFLTLVR